MFEISAQTEFAAAHSILIGGQSEPVHGHNWLVTAAVAAPALDHHGLVCDFHLVEDALRQIAAPFVNRSFNDAPPFRDGLNPTAENIARHFGDRLAVLLKSALPPGAAVAAVRVTEAPGCAATYRPLPISHP